MDREQYDSEQINSPKDLALVIKRNFIVIIKISATWCGPCKNKNFLESYHNLKSKYERVNGIKFIELDIDKNSDILEDKNYYDIDVGAVPTFLISKKGTFTRKYEGCGYLDKINEYIRKASTS
jgi:thiol-disulfide isomerase/thioredoxin